MLRWISELILTVKAVVAELRRSSNDFDALTRRVGQPCSPPAANPTHSFWTRDPPFPELVNHNNSEVELPSTADVIVIGSGITGTAVVHTLLKDADVKIVMLEARDVCSGATGRNGGHLKASPHEAFAQCLRGGMSPKRAVEVVSFQLETVQTLLQLGLSHPASETREVDTVDLYLDSESFEKGKQALSELQTHMPKVAAEFHVYEAPDAQREFDTSAHIFGALSYSAGAMWPYRLITSILNDLLAKHEGHFHLATRTPVTAIAVSLDTTGIQPYSVVTPRGIIRARHVVHATNGYASGLVPGLTGKLFPCRGQMTAQRPGSCLPNYNGKRSWSFISKKGFEYVTQRPRSDSTDGEGDISSDEILLGGGLTLAGLDEVGMSDDAGLHPVVGAYLGGIAPIIFGQHWGQDSARGRILDHWTGVLGFTIDALPMVGRLDDSLTGRSLPAEHVHEGKDKASGIPPGEWIAAGYNGEGMVNAWSCGAALASMILGSNDHTVPSEFLVSKRRLRRGSLVRLASIWGV